MYHNKILRFCRKAPTGAVNQRKNAFSIRFHAIGYSFMLLQPNALLFSTSTMSTLKPSVNTLSVFLSPGHSGDACFSH